METSEFKQFQEKSGPQERKLSEQRTGNLLSAIGNNEAKAITLLAMESDCVYSMGDLHREVIAVQGDNLGWRMAFPVPFKYCEWSLETIGLVAKKVVDPSLNTYGYIKTELGEDAGTAFAGLLLDLSKRYPDISLGQIFGSTISTAKEEDGYKKRSPAIRLKIFREILEKGLPIQEIDLVKALGESPSLIGSHLEDLGKNNVLSYRVSAPLYKIAPDKPVSEPEPYRGQYIQLTKTIYEILQSDSDKLWKVDEMINNYVQELDKRGVVKRGINRKNLQSAISGVLSHLARNEYANAIPQSEINLTESQRNMLLDVVSAIDAFQADDPSVIAKGKELAAYFLSHPEEVSQLMAKARKNSNVANRSSREETMGMITSIIKRKPDVSPSEVQYLLEEEYDKKLKIRSLREIIKQMIEKKIIQSSKNKNIQRLSFVN